MSIVKLSSAALLAVSLCACGSVVRGTSESIAFVSEPSGAAMTTNSKYACPATPCTLQVERSDEFDATFTLPGHRPETIPVRTKVVAGGAAGFAGNVLAGGLIGMGVDAYTGAALDHSPNPVFARLTPLTPPVLHKRGRAPRAGEPGM
ncbi:translation initiation factor 2 [Methylobacterium organophilum]|uniref:Translation initiation factor 2 n=1 Tax=Methylobacterium organophilum TaxID=410 RepID=A0ABQ4TC47_METOR|nr:translation initiation factor 2 [Methylobacterium organophilum]UMY15997.1 translation initiation factor 2 [Methylobacterium organophilum]GJE28460.1 hypothetical protein LKMONMHP_3331 [Methylobacterium organophilum]